MRKTLDKLKAKQPVTIVVVGDSTSVDTPWTMGRKNWVGYLNEALWMTYGDGLITMINSSRCGNTFAAELKRMEETVLRFRPHLVILSLGMAELLNQSFDLESSATQAHEMITVLQRSGAEVLVRTPNPVVYGYWSPLPPEARPGEAFDAKGMASVWAARLTAVARECGCEVVDHYAMWKAHRYAYSCEAANPQGLRMRMSGDTVHPGMIGHLAFFREMAPAFGVPRYFPWEEVQSGT